MVRIWVNQGWRRRLSKKWRIYVLYDGLDVSAENTELRPQVCHKQNMKMLEYLLKENFNGILSRWIGSQVGKKCIRKEKRKKKKKVHLPMIDRKGRTEYVSKGRYK